MELYYKNLISKEASLEKLVDDLMLVVQGASELAEAVGANLGPESHREITTRLQRLKAGCGVVKDHAQRSALAVDKVMHQYPYYAAGLAFSAGLVVGVILRKR